MTVLDQRIRLSRPRIVLAMLAGYWGAMFIATHLPVSWMLGEGATEALSLSEGGDKPIHFLAYAGLGFLLMTFFAVKWDVSARRYAAVALVCCVYAAVDELTQIPVGRTADWWDFSADVLGCGFGLACHVVALRVLGMLRSAEPSPTAETMS